MGHMSPVIITIPHFMNLKTFMNGGLLYIIAFKVSEIGRPNNPSTVFF